MQFHLKEIGCVWGGGRERKESQTHSFEQNRFQQSRLQLSPCYSMALTVANFL